MPKSRTCLILAGLAVAVWETVDIFWISTPAAAAVFAFLFFACTVWFWRRDSGRAAGALLLLFAVEGVAAPFLKHVMLVTRVCAVVLAVAGIVLAALVLTRRRPRVAGVTDRGLTERGHIRASAPGRRAE